MCAGNKKCKKCSARMGRRKTRSMPKVTTRSITTMAMDGLKGYAGLIVAKKVSQIPFVAGNPIIGVLAPLVVAGLLPTKGLGAVKVGMAVGAATNAVNAFAPGLAANFGLTGLAGPAGQGSFQIPGVAGINGLGQRRMNYNTPTVKVN
jgi:hypothetical protein